uniref:Uncharacterized protein n=1 Tax=Glossina pallidipes TaxID=7398 RepID=A0A1A9ZLH4_GLOPL
MVKKALKTLKHLKFMGGLLGTMLSCESRIYELFKLVFSKEILFSSDNYLNTCVHCKHQTSNVSPLQTENTEICGMPTLNYIVISRPHKIVQRQPPHKVCFPTIFGTIPCRYPIKKLDDTATYIVHHGRFFKKIFPEDLRISSHCKSEKKSFTARDSDTYNIGVK